MGEAGCVVFFERRFYLVYCLKMYLFEGKRLQGMGIFVGGINVIVSENRNTPDSIAKTI